MKDIDEECLDDLEALNVISFLGKDLKDRTVVYRSGSQLAVRNPIYYRQCKSNYYLNITYNISMLYSFINR